MEDDNTDNFTWNTPIENIEKEILKNEISSSPFIKNQKDLEIPATKNLFHKTEKEILQMCFIRNIPKQNKDQNGLILVDTPNLDQIHKNHQFNPK